MTNLYVYFPTDFEKRFAAFKEKVMGAPESGATMELSYDAESAKFSYRGQYLSLALATNQAVVAAALFNPSRELGKWLEEVDIHQDLFKVSKTSLYSAVRALNRAFKEKFGIEAFEYARDRARVCVENLTQK